MAGTLMGGLFGSRRMGWTPGINPQLGVDIARENGIIAGDRPGLPQAPAQQPTQPKERSTGRRIAGYFADFAAGLAGQQGPYAAMLQREQAQRDQEAQYQRQRADQFADWEKRQRWERANPAPTTNDTVADYQFLLEKLGPEAAEKFLRNRADPPRYVQGPDGQFYPVQTAQTPMRPVGKLTPIEGGPASAPGNFPLGQ